MKQTNKGFTLIEISIVLVIIGLIMSGMFVGLSATHETAKFKEDQQKLADIKSALLRHVTQYGYLPCPDTDQDGVENRNSGMCTENHGTLPYVTLKTHAKNGYGFDFRYHANRLVTTHMPTAKDQSSAYFASENCALDTLNEANPPCFHIKTHPIKDEAGNGNFNILDQDDQQLAKNVPLVIISHGKNDCQAVSGFEQINCDTSASDYYQAQQERNVFDDVVIWLSSLEIKKAVPDLFRTESSEDDYGLAPPPPGFEQPIDFVNTSYDNVSGDGSDIGTIDKNESVKITGDLDSEINFGSGNSDNDIYVQGDVNQDIAGANGNSAQGIKNMYIEGDLNADITLETNKDSYIEVGGVLNGKITLSGSGDHMIWIHGAVTENGSITLSASGNHKIFLASDIGGTITVAGSNSEIYLGKTTDEITAGELSKIVTSSPVYCRESTNSATFVACP